MKNRFLAASPISLPTPPPPEPAAAKKRGKKLYVAIAAVLAIVIIVAALMFIPQSNANVISLGVHYTAGEKLTYALTASVSSDSLGTSLSVSQDATVTVEVISLVGDTYTLNYTMTETSQSKVLTVSKVVEVQQSEMITALALLPAAFQASAAAGDTSNASPLVTAFFDQSQAKVGDTWNIPLNTENTTSAPAGNLTITFKGIQDLNVAAGNYHVFRMDLSTSMQSESALGNLDIALSGQSYLETGTCKQVQSNLQVTLSIPVSTSSGTFGLTMAITSTLMNDSA